MKRFFCIFFCIIICFSLCSCTAIEESWFGRGPLTEKEVLKVLKDEYHKDFSIVSAENTEDSPVIYTVKCNDIPDLTFTFQDMSDGMAGWRGSDDFRTQAFKYAAEKSGFRTDIYKYDSFYLDSDKIYITYKQKDGFTKTAEKLKNTVDLYFKLVPYFDGELKSHPSHIVIGERHEISFHFVLDPREGFGYTGNELCVKEKPPVEASTSGVVYKGMSVNEIKSAIKDYIYFP